MDLMTVVRDVLLALRDPHADIAWRETAYLKGLGVDAGRVALEIQLPYPASGWHEALADEVRAAVMQVEGVKAVSVDIRSRIHTHKVQNDLTPLPEVKNVIAVASGKGGVGKSTTAVNLALALQAEGARVGVLDADIYGPSIPKMLGLSGRPDSPDGKTIIPHRGHGLQVMSMGLLVGDDTPMIWRGPMVAQALQQLLNDTRWEGLDYLIVDLPPGTGDIQLTLAQRVPVSGAVIVTTPQEVATLDARKALKMLEKVEIPVLGIVENMAVHVCSACGHGEHVFGSGGGEWMASTYGVPLLGALPLDIRIREQSDGGVPIVAAAPDSPLSQAYRVLARNVAARLSLQPKNKAIAFPNVVVQNT